MDSDGTSVRSGADADLTSDYELSTASSGFTSIATSTMYHIYENGRYSFPPLPILSTHSFDYIHRVACTSLTPTRRYQSFIEGRYPLPNDEAEQNREEMQHNMVKELLDGNFCMAPIGDSPQKILDLGTGCGIWAIEGKLSLGHFSWHMAAATNSALSRRQVPQCPRLRH